MFVYKFHKHLLLRTPTFPYTHYHSFTLQQWLNAPYFLLAIALANKVVYKELEKCGFLESSLSAKMKRTLNNYLNRMHYRTVPFGLFAGCATVPWQEDGEPLTTIVLDPNVALYLLTDRKEIYTNCNNLLLSDPTEHEVYLNPSLYRSHQELRYIKPKANENDSGISFTIASIQSSKAIDYLMTICRSKINFKALVQRIYQDTANEVANIEVYLKQLLTYGFLLPDLEKIVVPLFQKELRPVSISLVNPFAPMPVMPINTQSAYYANTMRTLTDGQFPAHHQQDLLDGLMALNKLTPDATPDGLRKFKKDFQQKFDQQVVPLMVAMDPELGVGYANLEQSALTSDIMEALQIPSNQEPHKKLQWEQVHALLLDKLSNKKQGINSIELNDIDIAGLAEKPTVMPSGMSIVFRTSGKQLFLEACGGSCATALWGRFSLFEDTVYTTAWEVARKEIDSNPGVVFAEIESLQEYKVANIELRKMYYDYKIQIVTDTGSLPAKNIDLSDLWVTVRQDKIIIWSQTLNKEIIPRLSTAYNIQRSDLNIYRFLSELQYQGVRSNFHFDLSHYFPLLQYYPRVVYKNCILSLATWIIADHELKSIYKEKGTLAQHQALRQLLNSKACNGTIALGEDDNQLVFDTNKFEDSTRLLENMVGKKQITLKEFPFTNNKEESVAGDAGAFVGQWLTVLSHDQEVFKPSKLDFTSLTSLYGKPRQDNNWLYLKLYGHPSKADEQLQQQIYPFIKKQLKLGTIKKWHFIRYRDPDFHLRLRLLCHDANGKAMNWMMLSEILASLQAQGIFSAVQLDLYQRELERYFPYNINIVEDFFHWDAEWNILLSRAFVEDKELIGATLTTRIIIDQLIADTKERSLFAKTVFDAFFQEFHGDKNLMQSLMHQYQKRRIDMERMDETLVQRISSMVPCRKLSKVLQLLRKNKYDKQQIAELCTHLVHMHLNRYFADSPREKEMVTYYFLWRHYNKAHHTQQT